MIWFICKQCGKTHGRPESSVGSMIFCDCGHGNLVPWESTAPAPETPPEAPAAAPAPTPGLPSVPLPLGGADDLPEVLPRPRRRGRPQPDPAVCLNHETVASKHKCPDCGEAFCDNCVAPFQGQTLCGPCKNFRVRTLSRPPRVSGLAVVSAVLALITGPLAFCLWPFAVASGTALWSLLALVPQIAALVLAGLALRATEGGAHKSGRSLAITGLVTAVVACVLTLVVSMLVHRPLS
jgi:hypothetical protein